MTQKLLWLTSKYKFVGKKLHSHIVPINSWECSFCEMVARYYGSEDKKFYCYSCAKNSGFEME